MAADDVRRRGKAGVNGKVLLTGSELGRVLCETFGVDPKNVRRIEIRAVAGGDAEIQITRLVRQQFDVTTLHDVAGRYGLTGEIVEKTTVHNLQERDA